MTWLTSAEVAQAAGYARSTLNHLRTRWAESREVEMIQPGGVRGSWRYRAADVEEWIQVGRRVRDRILLAGDTHGNTMHVAHLIAVARKNFCPVLFVLGDFGYWEHQHEGVKFLDSVNKLGMAAQVTVFFLDGNHDKTSLLMDRYRDAATAQGFLRVRNWIRYAPRGLQWSWGNYNRGARFTAIGGAYSTDKPRRLKLEAKRHKPESLWFPEEEITDEELARILLTAQRTDVLLGHDKPRASNPQWNRKDVSECWPNQDRIGLAIKTLRPLLYVHGHLHYRYTDHVRVDGNTWCTVEGLDADPDAKWLPTYRREDSRLVLHIPTRTLHEAV